MKEVLNRNKQIVETIPAYVVNEEIKLRLLAACRNSMMRNISQEVLKKEQREWSLPRMSKLAKME